MSILVSSTPGPNCWMTSWILIYVREDSSILIPSLMLNPSREDISTIRRHLLGWCLLGMTPMGLMC